MLIYIFISGSLIVKKDTITGVKKFLGFGDTLSKTNDIGVNEGLFQFLNWEIDYGGKVKVKEAIVKSVEKYNNIKDDRNVGFIDKYGLIVLSQSAEEVKNKMA